MKWKSLHGTYVNMQFYQNNELYILDFVRLFHLLRKKFFWGYQTNLYYYYKEEILVCACMSVYQIDSKTTGGIFMKIGMPIEWYHISKIGLVRFWSEPSNPNRTPKCATRSIKIGYFILFVTIWLAVSQSFLMKHAIWINYDSFYK